MKVGEWSWSYRAATVPTDNLSLALYLVYALYHSPNVNRLKYIQDCIWASACQTAKKKKRKKDKPSHHSTQYFSVGSVSKLYFWSNWIIARTDFTWQTQTELSCAITLLPLVWKVVSAYRWDRICHFNQVLLGHITQHSLTLTYWSTSNKTRDDGSTLVRSAFHRSKERQHMLFMWATFEWEQGNGLLDELKWKTSSVTFYNFCTFNSLSKSEGDKLILYF